MQVYKDNNGLEVIASSIEANKPPDGNLYHVKLGRSIVGLKFQTGSPNINGLNTLNGHTNESLLAILIHRVEMFNEKVPCSENAIAIVYMKKALQALEARTEDRSARGVEGLKIS